MKYQSIAVAGPTASGKTKKAVAIATAFNGEILSADSRQVNTTFIAICVISAMHMTVCYGEVGYRSYAEAAGCILRTP